MDGIQVAEWRRAICRREGRGLERRDQRGELSCGSLGSIDGACVFFKIPRAEVYRHDNEEWSKLTELLI